MVAESINSRGAACCETVLPEDRKELVAGKEVIRENGIFKLLSMNILARQIKCNC
jgi:hypothetical protein